MNEGIDLAEILLMNQYVANTLTTTSDIEVILFPISQ